jgi:hypothetical protein
MVWRASWCKDVLKNMVTKFLLDEEATSKSTAETRLLVQRKCGSAYLESYFVISRGAGWGFVSACWVVLEIPHPFWPLTVLS